MALLSFAYRRLGLDRRGFRLQGVLSSPVGESFEDVVELDGLRGGSVFDPRRDLVVGGAGEESRRDESLESVGEGVRAELEFALEIDEAPRFVVHDEEMEDVEDVLFSE